MNWKSSWKDVFCHQSNGLLMRIVFLWSVFESDNKIHCCMPCVGCKLTSRFEIPRTNLKFLFWKYLMPFSKENWLFHLPVCRLLTAVMYEDMKAWKHSIKVITGSSCLSDLLTFPCFVQDSWYLPWTGSIAYIRRSMTCSHTTWDYERKTWHVNTKSLHVWNGAWINVGWQRTSHHQRGGSI